MKKRDFSPAEAAIMRSYSSPVVGGANAQTAISLACFDFSESVRANADDLINIHEPSSSIILSAFYMVINSRISFVVII